MWIYLITDQRYSRGAYWGFTHFFVYVLAPLFLPGFLKMEGVLKMCVKNDKHTNNSSTL